MYSGVKGSQNDQVDVWCFPKTKTKTPTRRPSVEAIGDVM